MRQRPVEPGVGIVARVAKAELSRQEDDVRTYILRAFTRDGRGPAVDEISQALGLSLEHVLRSCRKLAAHDLIVWEDGTTQILSAYPFSGQPTAHQVRIEGNSPLYAMCAIDALGIPFMLEQRATIASSCFVCQQPVQGAIQDGLIQHAEPVAAVVWRSQRDSCFAAKERCPFTNFFCNDGHLQRWLAERPTEKGTALTLREAVDVAKAAFGELLR